MFTPSVKLGNVNGIDFKISVGWVAILVVFIISLQNPEAYNRYLELIPLLTLGQITLEPAFPQSELAMLAFTTSILIGIYLSVILHEIGHATAALKSGIKVESIKLWVGGGVAKIDTIPPMKELFITIAGPTVTFILVPFWALISIVLFTLNLTAIAWIFLIVSLFNLLMLVFNLLPLYPLDGGRVLRSLLIRKTSYLKATKYAFYTTVTGISTAIILMITFGSYDYLLMSGIIGIISYLSYTNFKNTYDPEPIPDDFFIYEQTFAFDQCGLHPITDKQKQMLKNYIENQGGQTTQMKNRADFIVSADSFKNRVDPESSYISPLYLVNRLERNGCRLPQELKDQLRC